jgi:MoxR-like ATPase
VRSRRATYRLVRRPKLAWPCTLRSELDWRPPLATQTSLVEGGVGTYAALFESIVDNVRQVVHGKDEAIRLALVCLMAEGHLLVEDVPGVGKTSLAKSIASSLGLEWHRVQFTPDLLPSDVIGTSVFDRNATAFTFRPGAVFANVLLGDEINRASPKTQSALLEAMEERQVTVDGTTHGLPEPFLVVATQNPVEHEGTYALPESQIDRFLMSIGLGYPGREAEITMLEEQGGHRVTSVKAVAGPTDVMRMINVADAVHVAPALRGYVVDLADASRRHPALALGMSPRASIGLQRSAKALAASLRRDYVIPEDIKYLAHPVLEHRLVLTSEASLSGQTSSEIIADILDDVPVPTGRQGASHHSRSR